MWGLIALAALAIGFGLLDGNDNLGDFASKLVDLPGYVVATFLLFRAARNPPWRQPDNIRRFATAVFLAAGIPYITGTSLFWSIALSLAYNTQVAAFLTRIFRKVEERRLVAGRADNIAPGIQETIP